MIKSSDAFVSAEIYHIRPVSTTKAVVAFISAVVNKSAQDKQISRNGEIISVGACAPLNRLTVRFGLTHNWEDDRKQHDEVIEAVTAATRTRYYLHDELVRPILVTSPHRVPDPTSSIAEFNFYVYFL